MGIYIESLEAIITPFTKRDWEKYVANKSDFLKTGLKTFCLHDDDFSVSVYCRARKTLLRHRKTGKFFVILFGRNESDGMEWIGFCNRKNALKIYDRIFDLVDKTDEETRKEQQNKEQK